MSKRINSCACGALRLRRKALPRCRLRAKPRFFLLLIALACVFFSASCLLSRLQEMRLAQQAEALQLQKEGLEEKICTLNDRLAYVQTDAYIEHTARSELNMIYPGEVRYIIGS